MPTMNQSCRIFPSGNPVPGTPSSSVSPIGGSSATLTVSSEITEGDSTYLFIFWNVDATLTPPQETNGTPNPEQTVAFIVPSDDSIFAATAWYILLSGGSGSGGSVFAFSLNKDAELSNSPIGTITPASAQTDPNTFSTTTSPDPVVVTAPILIGGDGRFNQWLPYSESSGSSVNGRVLTVPANGAIEAIAFYGIPVPDPCQYFRDTLSNINCSDFPTPADCERAISSLLSQLIACERQYGELP